MGREALGGSALGELLNPSIIISLAIAYLQTQLSSAALLTTSLDTEVPIAVLDD